MDIYPVEQKMIDFEGAEILGVKMSDGKIYIGASYVCSGIGLSEGQRDRQVKNIQEDVVLKQGSRKLPVKFDGQVREVLVIDLEFLPLWLAKISITKSMEKNNPEMALKLVDYQLKAKDSLAKSFIPSNVLQIPTELNTIGQLLEITNHQFKALVNIQQKLEDTSKVAEDAIKQTNELQREVNDVKSGLVDVNIPLRTQFNDAVKVYKGKQQLNWDKAYNSVYSIVSKQHRVNIKLRAERRGKKPIDIIEELNLLVPAIRIAKTLAGLAS